MEEEEGEEVADEEDAVGIVGIEGIEGIEGTAGIGCIDVIFLPRDPNRSSPKDHTLPLSSTTTVWWSPHETSMSLAPSGVTHVFGGYGVCVGSVVCVVIDACIITDVDDADDMDGAVAVVAVAETEEETTEGD